MEILLSTPKTNVERIKKKIGEVHKLVLDAKSSDSLKRLMNLKTELQHNEGRIETLITLNLIDSMDYRLMKQEQSRLMERLQAILRIKQPVEVI